MPMRPQAVLLLLASVSTCSASRPASYSNKSGATTIGATLGIIGDSLVGSVSGWFRGPGADNTTSPSGCTPIDGQHAKQHGRHASHELQHGLKHGRLHVSHKPRAPDDGGHCTNAWTDADEKGSWETSARSVESTLHRTLGMREVTAGGSVCFVDQESFNLGCKVRCQCMWFQHCFPHNLELRMQDTVDIGICSASVFVVVLASVLIVACCASTVVVARMMLQWYATDPLLKRSTRSKGRGRKSTTSGGQTASCSACVLEETMSPTSITSSPMRQRGTSSIAPPMRAPELNEDSVGPGESFPVDDFLAVRSQVGKESGAEERTG